MIRDEDLMECLICYGRGTVQEFITRSPNIQDAIHYIQMERDLEMARLITFVTKDLRNFERRSDSL